MSSSLLLSSHMKHPLAASPAPPAATAWPAQRRLHSKQRHQQPVAANIVAALVAPCTHWQQPHSRHNNRRRGCSTVAAAGSGAGASAISADSSGNVDDLHTLLQPLQQQHHHQQQHAQAPQLSQQHQQQQQHDHDRRQLLQRMLVFMVRLAVCAQRHTRLHTHAHARQQHKTPTTTTKHT